MLNNLIHNSSSLPQLSTGGLGGYHFWVGNSSLDFTRGQTIANEKARFDDVIEYRGEDVVLTLPREITVFDI